MKARVIAFYLPQFHAIPENDEWWGKGFTDWVNVKKTRPTFKGHLQPRIPLNNNYYNLSNPDTLRWQASLAQRFSIDGFCFYHYWFNGKLLLEKPAELLLQNKDINISFCFSWANEPWARTWDGKAHHILIGQDYGDKNDWEKHFEYLLPFFNDDRYIKIDNAPVFLIYKSASIPCAGEMMELWNMQATKAGFNGIHFVETIRDKKMDSRILPFKSRVEFEPACILSSISVIRLYLNRIRRLAIALINKLFHISIPQNKVLRFCDITQKSLSTTRPTGTWGGAFLGWDNTPRRGLKATIVLPPSKEELKEYLRAKLTKMENEYKTDILFINAWNEWAEGTYLEPDTSHEYEYLEVIKRVVNNSSK